LFRRHFLALVAFLLLSLSAAAAPAEQWIVVPAPAFRETIKPLWDHRKDRGMRVRVVEADAAKELQNQLHKLCRDFEGTSYILLVGAIEGDDRKTIVPALVGTTGRMKGEPSDNGYGCPDGTLLPSVAVGRFPARSVAEARAMVDKTLAYERDRRPGEWRRRVVILAGAPMFTPAVDGLVERVAMSRLDRLDPSWSGKAIYHNPSSRFCVPDAALRARARRYVEEGEAITLYLGHSNALGFAPGQLPYMERGDWAKMDIPRGAGLFATFGCFGCQLRGRDGEGYGVAAARNLHGPVAVLGSHGICFAAMVHLAADGFVESFFARQPPARLGACWLSLKTGLAKGNINPITFRLLDALDGDSKISEETQRLEHLEMFVLLGDPALRLNVLPVNLELKAPAQTAPGETITIEGTAPAALEGAKLRLTLERPLSSDPTDLQPLDKVAASERDTAMLQNHDRANRFGLKQVETTIKDGRFTEKLQLPEKIPWPQLTLRVYARTEKDEGLGVAVIKIKTKDEK
jgi:hypothetical protein